MRGYARRVRRLPPVVLIAFASVADIVLALHILGVLAGFGVLFAFPLLMLSAQRLDPAVIPWLLRARVRLGRILVNPGLTLVVAAGVFLATDEHYWSAFFVQWGIGAALVLGAIEGSVIIRVSGRLAKLAERDLAASGVPAGGQRVSAQWSAEYQRLYRRLSLSGWAAELLVIVTVFLMATHA